MIVLRFLIEWVLCFFAIWGLFILLIKVFKRRVNPITAVIFAFTGIGLLVFLTFSYLIHSVSAGYIYMPIMVFWFVYYLREAHLEMSE